MAYALARMVDRAVCRWEEANAEGRAADWHFDGGEWSGAAWHHAEDEYIRSVQARIAAWAGITPEELDRQWQQYMHATEQMVFDGELPMSVLW